MAFNLTLRTTKGNRLTLTELDNNFLYLKDRDIVAADIVGDDLVLTKQDGGTFSVPLSGITSTDTFTNYTPMPVDVGGWVEGSTFSGKTMQEMWDGLLYPYQYPEFDSFVLSTWTASRYEIGTDIPTNQIFTWNTDIPANVATNSIQISGYELTTLTGLSDDSTENITFNNIVTRGSSDGPGSRTWTIQGTNTDVPSSTFSRNFSIRWDYIMYAGTNVSTSLTSGTTVSLSDFNSLKQGFTGTYNMSAGGYKYFCWADTYGDPTNFIDDLTSFNVAMYAGYGNTDGSGFSYDLVSVTNSEGETTNYRVYRSQNILGSTIDIRIT
jgi:hypothetical protein